VAQKKVSPAEYVIAKFGGVSATARALGINRSSVSLWRTRSKGQIPSRQWVHILRASREQDLAIKPENLYTVPTQRKAVSKK